MDEDFYTAMRTRVSRSRERQKLSDYQALRLFCDLMLSQKEIVKRVSLPTISICKQIDPDGKFDQFEAQLTSLLTRCGIYTEEDRKILTVSWTRQQAEILRDELNEYAQRHMLTERS